MSGKKIVTGPTEAVAESADAISAVYLVLEKYPRYALAPMNDHLASEIVRAVRVALTLGRNQ